MASRAHHPEQEHSVARAAASVGRGNDVALAIGGVEPGDARRLHEQARMAYRFRDTTDPLELALKAFGANPGDPEIAGHLAFLHLEVVPERAEVSLPLSMYAIGLRSVHQRSGLAQDWTTFATASALTGRPIDARDALYVALALARNVDRLCREAVGALARHGERLREPVEALLYRVHMQGRSGAAPFCAWPPVRITRHP
jgi:hypothetical protein